MGKRHPNYRLVKIHRNYSVEDIARLCGKHKNTVRAWLKDGLCPIDKGRPVLVHGQVLAAFLKGRRTAGKRPSPPGHLYCFKCREPKPPAEGVVTVQAITDKVSNVSAVCPDVRRHDVSAGQQSPPEGIRGELGRPVTEGGATHR
jgi:Helix-turn-helix domain